MDQIHDLHIHLLLFLLPVIPSNLLIIVYADPLSSPLQNYTLMREDLRL